MGDWREVAARVLADRPAPVTSAVPDAMPGVPDPLAEELRRLERAMTPKVNEPEIWRQAVADALRIARDGWAGQALSLGWSVSDLFGIDPRDAYDFSGLAVWLTGRHLVMLDADRAVVETDTSFAYFNRGGLGHGADAKADPVPLWRFGRRP
jgi:hypothetical protein